jgi:hypothetical protein
LRLKIPAIHIETVEKPKKGFRQEPTTKEGFLYVELASNYTDVRILTPVLEILIKRGVKIT